MKLHLITEVVASSKATLRIYPLLGRWDYARRRNSFVVLLFFWIVIGSIGVLTGR